MMRNIVKSYVEKFKNARHARRRAVSILVVLALLVSCGVYRELRVDGLAMADETLCGQVECSDGEEWYEQVLMCGSEENDCEVMHVHTEACYEPVLICEIPEQEDGEWVTGHRHSEACYESVLMCGIPEQTESDEESDEVWEELTEFNNALGDPAEADDAMEDLTEADVTMEDFAGTDGALEDPAEADDALEGLAEVDDALEDPAEANNTLEDPESAASADGEDVLLPAVDDTQGMIAEAAGPVAALQDDDSEPAVDISITWNADSNRSIEVKVIPYFDNVKDPALASQLSDKIVSYKNEFRFREGENELISVDGYRLVDAKLYIGNSKEAINVYSITKLFDWDSYKWTYTYKYYDGGGNIYEVSKESNDVSMYVELFYEYIPNEATGDLTIVDMIPYNGCLEASYTGEFADDDNFRGDYYYHWFILDGYDDYGTEIWKAYAGLVSDTISVYSFGARQTFMVELVRIADDGIVAKSKPFTVPYYDELQNGSFEEPAIKSSNQVTNGLYPELVWHTTGFGSFNTEKGCDGQDIEIVVAGNESKNSYGVGEAKDGRQFVELNCEYDGTLYQDVLTAPGNNMYWNLSHRARLLYGYTEKNCIDTMCVIAVPTLQAQGHIMDQSDINAILAAAFPEYRGNYSSLKSGERHETEFEYTFSDGETVSGTVWLLTSDNQAWYDYSGEFEVPEGQYLTRFLFGAVYTTSSSTDHTLGNLIDAVYLSPMPTPDPGKGNLSLTKKLSGVSADTVVEAGRFRFDVYTHETGDDGKVTERKLDTVTLPTQDATPLDEAYWTVVWTNEEFLAGTYYVEEAGYDIDGYTYVEGSTVHDIEHSGDRSETESDGVHEGLKTNQFMVYEGEYTYVTYSNAYVPSEIALRKTDGISGETLDGARFILTDDEGREIWFKSETVSDDETGGTKTIYTAASEGDDGATNIITFGDIVLSGLPGAEYTLTETEAPDGYKKLADPVVFTFAEGKIRVVSGDAYVYATDALTIVVENISSAELPETGGCGTRKFILFGLLLAGGAAALLHINRRRGVLR